jgi:hypothetical protein
MFFPLLQVATELRLRRDEPVGGLSPAKPPGGESPMPKQYQTESKTSQPIDRRVEHFVFCGG